MTEAVHNLRPVRPGRPKGRHVLLYVEEIPHNKQVVAGKCNAWVIDLVRDGWECEIAGSWENVDQLDSLLDAACKARGEITIWLQRGWTDLVLTGLAQLMDTGVITWRYASLSGRSCLIRGMYRGHKICITAITNWSGNRWDSWGDATVDAAVQRLMTAIHDESSTAAVTEVTEQRQCVATMAAIVSICDALSLPRVPPTAGAAGMLVWRAWLGPRVLVETGKVNKKKKRAKRAGEIFVAPMVNRPSYARQAERHVCYPLMTKQLRRGHVDEPMYCLDVSSAYLIGLSLTPVPVMYDATLSKPSVSELVNKMPARTGLALVRIKSEDNYYPCRINGHTVHCKGRMWTWLCGADLMSALIAHDVQEVWTAYLWRASRSSDKTVEFVMSIKDVLSRNNKLSCAAAWRSIYSALVGRYAGWQRVWEDSPAHAGFGRWAQWLQAEKETGAVIPHRAIAGRVQRLAAKSDKGDAVPLLYGCVTSHVRWIVSKLCQIAGWPNVMAIAADSIWLNTAGWQKCLRGVSECGLSPDGLKTKDIYDRAWFTGKSAVVAERHGKQRLLMPGISKGTYLDANGNVTIEHTDDWTSEDVPTPANGIRRRRHVLSAIKIIEQNRSPAIVLPVGETVDVPLLGEYLLQPIKGERTIEDV